MTPSEPEDPENPPQTSETSVHGVQQARQAASILRDQHRLAVAAGTGFQKGPEAARGLSRGEHLDQTAASVTGDSDPAHYL